MKLSYVIEDEIIVKEFLKEQNLSRKLLRKIKSQDAIRINGEGAKNYYLLHKGDLLEIVIEENMNDSFVSGTGELDILYEDDNYLIINKSKGVAVQPSRKHFNDSLFALIKSYYEEKGINANIHIVTRLDLDTTGIVLVAKNGYIHSMVNDINFEKLYLCKCYNSFSSLDGVFEEKIARVSTSSIKRWVSEDGKNARTQYHVLENGEVSLVECKLLTGRTHQIRVHMAYHNHPLLGDKLYGINDNYDLMLHCYSIKFACPISGKEISVKCYPSWYK